ncbi:MAG: TRAP transporter small permease [Paracoccaceae bacterium]|nr:TRAP dicarboxylate transporter family protein, DctQ subunit [Rhodobacteraceae bacterium HTCC2150]MDG1532782.1 TRAP transporter small permease [Paracoccaceae bacterium]
MRKFLNKTERLADSAGLFAANVSAIILLVLVALTCADVVGRYFFSRPVVGAVELVRICMAGIIFFSFPLMFLRNDQIIVDLVRPFRKGYLGWVIAIVILSLTVFVAIKLGDRVFDYAVRAFEDGDTTEYLGIPRYIVVSFITMSIFIAAIMTLLRLALTLASPGEDQAAEFEDDDV